MKKLGVVEENIVITSGYAMDVIFDNTDKWDHIDPSIDFYTKVLSVL